MEERYPQIEINLKRIQENVQVMIQECEKRGLELIGVEKLVAGNFEIAKIYWENGIQTIADSRIQNLKKLKDLPVKKMLLRIPMPSEIEDLVNDADICLISEIAVIKQINQQTTKPFEIILMIETGDIREGLLNEKMIFSTVKEILTLPKIKLVGIGTNFACYGATIPTVDKLIELVNLKKRVETEFQIQIPKISCGNSSHITIWDDSRIPAEINQIRSGAAILMGIGLNDQEYPFLNQNNFKLKTQIVELQMKPSASWGPRGLDAFAHEFTLPDIGIRKKALVAFGRQDAGFESLTPIDSKIKILGQSSDHTILDLTEAETNYQVGDVIEFNLDYLGVLSCFTSEFVFKKTKNIKTMDLKK